MLSQYLARIALQKASAFKWSVHRLIIAVCYQFDKLIYSCCFCRCCRIGRHSKSLDTKAKVCGYCHSPFALVTKSAATPRTPNKFALFVKENYGSMKRDNNTHKDVMRMLSSDFARQNSISASRGQKEL